MPEQCGFFERISCNRARASSFPPSCTLPPSLNLPLLHTHTETRTLYTCIHTHTHPPLSKPSTRGMRRMIQRESGPLGLAISLDQPLFVCSSSLLIPLLPPSRLTLPSWVVVFGSFDNVYRSFVSSALLPTLLLARNCPLFTLLTTFMSPSFPSLARPVLPYPTPVQLLSLPLPSFIGRRSLALQSNNIPRPPRTSSSVNTSTGHQPPRPQHTQPEQLQPNQPTTPHPHDYGSPPLNMSTSITASQHPSL